MPTISSSSYFYKVFCDDPDTFNVTDMYNNRTIALLMPARNESLSLPVVPASVPSIVDRVLVLDNGSTDDTACIASNHGAEIISEPRQGYGQAFLTGMAALMANPPDVVAFDAVVTYMLV